MWKSAFLAILAASLPITAHADDDIVPSITVTGYAESKVSPDKAVVNVQVYTEYKLLDAAKAEQDKKVKQLVAIASAKGVKPVDIRTRHANVQPQYDYVQVAGQQNKRVFRAYALTNSIEVTIRNLTEVGPVMDQLVKAGFDRIDNVQFGLENQREHEEAMLGQALKHAKQKASNMATALGARIGKPLAVTESGASQPPVLYQAKGRAMAMMAEDAGGSMPSYTPEGVIPIQKTVNVTFELE